MFLRITGVKLQIVISLSLYVGSIFNGCGATWIGPVMPKLRDLEQSPLTYLLTETQLALLGSFTYLGAIPGPYIINWLSNTKGRKPCLIAGSLVGVLSYIILAIARNFAMLLIARFLFGVSNGTVATVNYVYIGEIASPKIRGILLSLTGTMFTLGSIFTFSTGPYVSYHGTIYICTALAVLHFLSLLWIPESPIFYALQGNDKEVVDTLNDLGRSQDVDKMLEIRKDLKVTSVKKDWEELLSIKSNRKALFIVVVINCLVHGSGVMVILFFSAAIFEMAGSSISGNIAMIIIGVCKLMGSTVTPFFVESIGRQIILIISSAICCLSMFTLGTYFYLDYIHNPIIDYTKWVPLVVLVIFYVGYDFGLGIIPMALIGEMFTTNVRNNGSTLAITSSCLVGFIVTTAFGSLFTIVGGHVLFWFFSAICACAALFTIFFIPETKGKTLLEIQEALS